MATGDLALKHLKESADQALYEAKSFGRNHVVISAMSESRSRQAVASAQY